MYINLFIATLFLNSANQDILPVNIQNNNRIIEVSSSSTSIIGQELHVVFQNIESEKGQIWISVCLEKQLWNRDGKPCEHTAKIPAKEGANYTFKDITSGTYAVTAFHDEDDNGRLDMDSIGIPFEPTGVSRNAVGNYGPPLFKDMKFSLPPRSNNSRPLQLNIKMTRYEAP